MGRREGLRGSLIVRMEEGDVQREAGKKAEVLCFIVEVVILGAG